MKGVAAKIYSWALLALFLAGSVAVLAFAWGNLGDLVKAVCGIFLSVVFAPAFHELGHVAFGAAAGLKTVYCKFFCFAYLRKDGKGKIRFANPFADDETQVIPVQSGDMQNRFARYALGGLVLGGVYLALVLAGATLLSAFGRTNFLLWGMLPYALYLVAFNAVPAEYPSGKTDMLVYRGLKKGYDSERAMAAALETQALLYEGKRFADMQKSDLFGLPVLPDDDPVKALLVELQYRFLLETEDYAGAYDVLNRWVDMQEYLSAQSYDSLAIELAYFDLLHGSLDGLSDAKEVLGDGLGGSAAGYRALALDAFSRGAQPDMQAFLEKARAQLAKEEIAGLKKHEEILLSRMETALTAQGSIV